MRSDDLAGHGIGPLQIQRSGNTALRFLRTSTLKRGGAPSCCIHILSRTAKDTPHFSVHIHNHINAVFPGRWIGRVALFHGLRGHLTWIPFIISIGISKFTCVWEPSRNGHGISCLNCSCLWYYSKHIRDICQGAAESCTSMSFLHWGW